jgi:hypothetical protein
LFAAILSVVLAQDLREFTRAQNEHIIVELDRPLRVRSVAGAVVLKGEGAPIPKVLFEVRGPGESKKIRRTVSGEDGRFVLRHVPPGTYRFKATLNGMQSVMGTLIVLRKGPADREIRIEMTFGV